MKFALQLGYWGAAPPTNHAELVTASEDAGFDTVFTAEAWGSTPAHRDSTLRA
jgi:alkanesulfonate monooxygenase SsuD/methylene tetrahydromethanopterin reductase-like flavin-dependent oxidoreductase (luciferase family)